MMSTNTRSNAEELLQDLRVARTKRHLREAVCKVHAVHPWRAYQQALLELRRTLDTLESKELHGLSDDQVSALQEEATHLEEISLELRLELPELLDDEAVEKIESEVAVESVLREVHLDFLSLGGVSRETYAKILALCPENRNKVLATLFSRLYEDRPKAYVESFKAYFGKNSGIQVPSPASLSKLISR